MSDYDKLVEQLGVLIDEYELVEPYIVIKLKEAILAIRSLENELDSLYYDRVYGENY